MNAITPLKKYTKINLGQVCQVLSGFNFKGRVESSPSGEFLVIQMRNIAADITGIRLDLDSLIRIRDQGFQSQYLARKGDVLFCARGANNFALHLTDPPEKAVIPGQFIIIRPQSKTVSSEFLAWYLNHTKTQRTIAAIRGGSATQIVTSAAISEIEIVIPTPDTQQMIIKLAALQRRERALVCELQKRSDTTIDKVLINLAEGKPV